MIHDDTRWLPRQGRPHTIVETVSQAVVKAAACLPFYIAFMVTLILIVQLAWGLH